MEVGIACETASIGKTTGGTNGNSEAALARRRWTGNGRVHPRRYDCGIGFLVRRQGYPGRQPSLERMVESAQLRDNAVFL